MHVIAVDLGASNGRVMKCTFEDGFKLSEVHRFPNVAVQRGIHLSWNIQQLWRETIKGIDWASDGAQSIGIDSWGVDFGLLDHQGNLLEDPVHYRDPRTNGLMEWVFQRIPRREIFDKTGIQFLELNTIYQLASLSRRRKTLLSKAGSYLGFPDLFNHWLTGEKKAEYTHATTTQCFNQVKHKWDSDILEAIGVSVDIFPEIVYPGEILGAMKNMSVSIPACHDTGSAVVAVPSADKDFVYLSSGTWSLMGTETKAPVINDQVYELNFTNEGGVEKTNRLLKNLPGLWFEQELMREWTGKGSPITYQDLYKLASTSEPFRFIINPADPRFMAPGDMTPRIVEYCREHGLVEPLSMAEHIRCVYDSLALSYLYCLEQLESIMGKQYSAIHIIGGGSLNQFLNQLAADVTGRKIIAGPVEAATLGNAIMQHKCIGLLASISEARQVLIETARHMEYHPEDGLDVENAYNRYRELIQR
ncbi:rhamnulokinase [Candidatus Bathyarchaeota archaeon]|nr:rhamnulokinase [Candidatus Bathyarchaeota archaeon]